MSLALTPAALEAVEALARRFPIFPCRAVEETVTIGGRPRTLKPKTPLIARGFHAASQDPEQIRAWWGRWPDALVGVPTGSLTALVVVDYDSPKADTAGRAWLEAHADALMSTRSHTTLSGGRHYLFRANGTKYRSGVCVDLAGSRRGGVDIRAEGGYIIWWPAHGGTAEGEFADLPLGLLEERAILQRELPPLPASSPARWRRDERILCDVLTYLDPTDYDCWIKAGMAIHLASSGSDEGFALWHAWSAGELTASAPTNYAGVDDCRYRWASFTPGGSGGAVVGLGSLIVAAKAKGYVPRETSTPAADDTAPRDDSPPLDAYVDDPEAAGRPAVAALDDFYAYLPAHQYLYIPTRELWPAASVNASVPVDTGKPSQILDLSRPVHQMTWAPAEGMLIEGRLVSDGGWIQRPEARVFNLYRPPQPISGNASLVTPWLDHIAKVYPEHAAHLISWLAHRVQHPGEKVNHAIVLGGSQGIGKDSLLEPVKYAVGHWNFSEVTPTQLLGRFNGFLKCVILRMSEARDLGDVDRYGLYEHLKPLTAAPPDVLRVDEKNLREYSVFNVCGVIITTNHIDGIYLPPDDRRHYVAWSELTKEEFTPEYWRDLYRWYREGGIGHVVEFLRTADLSGFDPKAPPPQTEAWHRMVDAGRAPEDGEIADVIDALNSPGALTIEDVQLYASDDFRAWLKDRRNSRQIPHRLEAVGYVPVRNEHQADGRWKVCGKNVVVYAKRQLTLRDRIAQAKALCEGRRPSSP